MTFCHSLLLDQALDAISSRESVVLAGRPLSGRTTVLHGVAQHLREAGHEPVLVRGVRGLTSPLSSLELSQLGLPLSKQYDGSLPAVYAVLVDRLRQHDQALLVDDLEHLDPTSLALVQHAAARTRVPVLATVRSRGLLVDELPFPAALRLDMRPLTFEDAFALLADVLGGPVEPATVARLLAKTAGVPGLVIRFASAARRAGRLVERGGVWQGASDLWSPSVARVVSGLVVGLPQRLVHGVEQLAHAGALPVGQARALVGDEALVELEDLRLVDVAEAAAPGTEPSVAVTPPLLAQCLQRERTVLSRLLGHPEGAAGPWTDDLTASAHPADRMPPNEAALIQERLRGEHRTRRAVWERDPGPQNASPLLEVMIARGVDRREIGEVVERTPVAGSDDAVLVRYLGTVARWRAWVDDDLHGALEVLDHAAVDVSPEATEQLAVLGRYLASVGEERADGGPLQVPEVTGRAELRLAPVLTAIVAGDGQAAAAALADAGEPASVEERALTAHLEVQTVAFSGDLREVAERSDRYRVDAMRSLDPYGIAMHSHNAAVALFLQGRFAEAEAILDEALTVGVPPFPYMPLHVANLTVFAALQARRGRFDAAEVTQRQAERFGIVYSFHALASPAWSRAYIDALREGDEAVDRLWEVGAELEARGFLPAALSVWTLGVGAWSPERVTHLRASAARVGGSLFSPLVTYHEALASNDADELESAFVELQHHDRPFFAGVVARALAALHRADEPLADAWRARANELAEEVGCAALDLAPGRSLRSNVTPREQDILRLVVAGRSNADIAASCFLSVRTVENHVHRIIRKLGVSSRAELKEVWK